MSTNPAARLRALSSLAAIATLASLSTAQNPKAIKAAEAWIHQYRAGKLDLSKPRINQNSPGVRAGLIDTDRARTIGHAEELEAICAEVIRIGGEEAAECLVAVAATGLDPEGRYDIEQRPAIVRLIGERHLDQLDDADAMTLIEEFAGDTKADDEKAARCAAAIRTLGRRKAERFVPHIEAALAAESPTIRLAGAEAAGDAKLAVLLPHVTEAIRREKQENVLVAELDAVRAIVDEHRESLDEERIHAAAMAAIDALGRATWRSDLAAVEILEKLRSSSAIDPLIDVLTRQVGSGEDGAELRSGVLQERTHEVLKSLTGAVFPAEDPAAWRRWWKEARGTFQVAEVKESVPAEAGQTVTGDFFGIPVRGSRVLFIVDTSGSMAEAWRGDDARNGMIKLDVAKRELLKVVGRLTADTAFNMVWFGNGADVWQRDITEATEKNKKKFEKQVEDLRADGGTNFWQGLRDGLRLESIAHGDRYGSDFDELFILSDGMPSLGQVTDPKEILQLVRETNRFSRVTIHTVYVASSPEVEKKAEEVLGMRGVEFMRQLAEQSGGTAVAFGTD